MSDENLTEAELEAEAYRIGLEAELAGLHLRTTPQTPRRIGEVEAELARVSGKAKSTRLRAAGKETR